MRGTGVSKGIGMGKALIYRPAAASFQKISEKSCAAEKARFLEGVEKYMAATREILPGLAERAGKEQAQILESHIEIAQDPEITSRVNEELEKGFSAEYAAETVFEEYAQLFENMGDELLAQRAADLRDIKNQIISGLGGASSSNLADIKERCVLVAHELTPSDTGRLDTSLIAAVVSETGGYTSHAAILSRALGIPAVLGAEGALAMISDGDYLIADGKTGEITINPGEEAIIKAEEAFSREISEKQALMKFKDMEAISRDGFKAIAAANIGSPKDIPAVLESGAMGIGLFRTEFLFMDRDSSPTEEEQLEAYSAVAKAMAGKPVIIRTSDIGGDKDIPYLGMKKEENPFLGFRGIRLCLSEREMFRTQLRAILRAGVLGNLKIMLPMVSVPEEIRDTKKLLEELKIELRNEGKAFAENIELGIMIETPAAAVCADIFAKEADFFSIGSNDLIQYTLAADRGNRNVGYLYRAENPAVLRLISRVIRAAKERGIFVGMCGESAADPNLIPFLLAEGLSEFSASPSSVLEIKKLIAGLDKKAMEQGVDEILAAETADEALGLLKKLPEISKCKK